jgi:hypothetical protein
MEELCVEEHFKNFHLIKGYRCHIHDDLGAGNNFKLFNDIIIRHE